MVRNLSVRHSHVYVISGSIFDENSDGHRDADSNITRLVLRSLCLLSIVLIMLSLPTHLFAQQAGAYHGFRSMKRLGVFLLHLGGKQVHHRVTPSIKFAGTHLSGERDFEGEVSSQVHIAFCPAWNRTRAARSGVDRTRHKTTASPDGPKHSVNAFCAWEQNESLTSRRTDRRIICQSINVNKINKSFHKDVLSRSRVKHFTKNM